ncbi:Aldo/keto reductase [Dacryopinax primogenitus]|uniref:Aldo/keto reductase n=1 Tax=Dacryopinax primogenitus (strain DJM 731) TaxID=1858805 RepID=M5FRU8_DACPD|nr:Aldo/keto reductase [Dacryopinax primogenitus]EJT99960.1 Aldo/keto reductase [Dacryopinax primogenitus]
MASIILKGSGQKMPIVGFGLWKVTKSSCADTVYNAIKHGYRLLDGAGDYGNEKEAGEGVARAIKDGLVKREELFITSKLWNTFHAREHVRQMADYQLKLWGIEYFDLFLIHFPVSLKYVDPGHRYPPEWFGDDGKVYTQNTPIQETWEAMEELHSAGLAKNIGISNFAGGLIIDLMRYARVPPAVLQIEHHPYLTQEHLVRLAQEFGIAITAYSSFGPQSFVELNMDRDAKLLLEHDTVTSIAAEHDKTPAQVLLRWATQRGIAVIPKSNNQKRLEQNLHCIDFNLSPEQIKEISSLNHNLRFNDPADIDVRLSIFA